VRTAEKKKKGLEIVTKALEGLVKRTDFKMDRVNKVKEHT